MPVSLDLVHIAGPALERARWRLPARFRIGRTHTCELALPEPSVSRLHAVIEADAGGWSVSDCGSRLGTRLNELALAPDAHAALHAADVIEIGPWRFRLELAESAPIEAAVANTARAGLVERLGNLAEQRLELLLRCAGEVASARDEHALADALAEHALLGSGYARAAVIGFSDGEFAVRSVRPEPVGDSGLADFDLGLIDLARGGDVARFDVDAATLTGAAGGRAPRHALCAPLMLDGRAEAFLYLDSQRSIRRGHTDAPTFAQALARLAALALSNLRRLANEREQALLTADIERAREVQRRLLPDHSRLTGGVRYALHLHPGRSVAGDIVDVIELPGGRIAALLGDVSGAGLGAGLIMASVQSFLRAELAHHDDPARALARLNAHLFAQSSGGRFVTLWLGIFDAAARTCRCVDAGHGHALRLCGDGSAEPLSMRGDIPLGIDDAAQFRAETLALEPGETILLYSDGVTEQRARDGEPFGRGRLLAALREKHAPADTIAAALAALAAHAGGAPPDDDMTLLAIGWSTA